MYPDSNPTVLVSSTSITQTNYNANGTVNNVNNYLTAIPSNNGMTTNGANVTYSAYKPCAGQAAYGTNGSPCYQGNGSVTITNVANPTFAACAAGTSCIDGMPAPSATSVRPAPSCKAAISFEAANRLVSVVPSASSVIGPATLHLAALAMVGSSVVSQSLVPRTGDTFSINPNFDSSKLSPNVISQTRTTTVSGKAVFDICLDSGYIPNTPPGLNAQAVISANAQGTQYVMFSTPQQ